MIGPPIPRRVENGNGKKGTSHFLYFHFAIFFPLALLSFFLRGFYSLFIFLFIGYISRTRLNFFTGYFFMLFPPPPTK